MASRAPKQSGNKRELPFEKKYLALLQALRYSNKDQRLALLRNADKKLVQYICECALNVLNGVVELKIVDKKKLKKYKKTLRNLANLSKRKTGWKNKKRMIVQEGGNFLVSLLGPVLDLIL